MPFSKKESSVVKSYIQISFQKDLLIPVHLCDGGAPAALPMMSPLPTGHMPFIPWWSGPAH